MLNNILKLTKSLSLGFIRLFLVFYFVMGDPRVIGQAFASPISNNRVELIQSTENRIRTLKRKLKRLKRQLRSAKKKPKAWRKKVRRIKKRIRYFKSLEFKQSVVISVESANNSQVPNQVQPTTLEAVSASVAPQASLALASVDDSFPEVGGVSAGYVDGNFSVNEGGSAIYQMGVSVPPGINGMEPKLSIVYDSRGANTIIGQGFALAGLSSITRCPTTIAQDDFADAVDFDDNDKFCLDGQRLVATQGEYGDNNTLYRTENETFSKITSKKTSNPGPERWTVQTKSGLTYYYGGTGDSQIEASGRTDIAMWLVDKIKDNAGNYLEVEYNDDAGRGETFPIEIRYSGNEPSGIQPFNRVVFYY